MSKLVLRDRFCHPKCGKVVQRNTQTDMQLYVQMAKMINQGSRKLQFDKWTYKMNLKPLSEIFSDLTG